MATESMDKTSQQLSALRILIDGRWSVKDMQKLLSFCQRNYRRDTVFTTLVRIDDPHRSLSPPTDPIERIVDEWVTTRSYMSRRGVRENEQLLIRRIEYGSPGSITLVGIGDAIEGLRKLLLLPLDYIIMWRTAKLDLEARVLHNEAAQIENEKARLELNRAMRADKCAALEERLDLFRKYGLSEEKLRKASHDLDNDLAIVELLILEDKLVGVEEADLD